MKMGANRSPGHRGGGRTMAGPRGWEDLDLPRIACIFRQHRATALLWKNRQPVRVGFTVTERRLVAGAAAIVFARVFAFSLTMLGFTEYARSLADPRWGADAAALWAGIALGAYGLTMAVAQLASGVLSDRIGRRPVLIGGAVMFLGGAVASAIATDVVLLAVARLLMGLGGVSSVAMAAVGESVPAERRTTAMALIGIPAGIAVFLGFAIGPVIASAATFGAVLWTAVAVAALSFLPALMRLPDPLPGLAQPAKSLSRPVLGLGIAGFAVNYAMTSVMFDFQTGVLDQVGSLNLGIMLASAFVVMGLASRAVDKGVGPRLILALALVLLASAAPILRLSGTLIVAIVAGIAFFAAHATLSAVIPSQVSRLAGRAGGKGHGFQLVLAYLGSATGGIVTGAFAHNLAISFVILAVPVAVAVLTLWGTLPQVSSERATASAP